VKTLVPGNAVSLTTVSVTLVTSPSASIHTSMVYVDVPGAAPLRANTTDELPSKYGIDSVLTPADSFLNS
jgi:hypothetical protein